jgi:Crp-like helix-turn-helix domain
VSPLINRSTESSQGTEPDDDDEWHQHRQTQTEKLIRLRAIQDRAGDSQDLDVVATAQDRLLDYEAHDGRHSDVEPRPRSIRSAVQHVEEHQKSIRPAPTHKAQTSPEGTRTAKTPTRPRPKSGKQNCPPKRGAAPSGVRLFLMLDLDLLARNDLSLTDKVVLAYLQNIKRLASGPNGRGIVQPTQQAMAKALGVSRARVGRSCKKLEEMGLIGRKRRGHGRSTIYTVE